ncbi:DNA internalization-related competence protein ComEC/Rec2 [Acetobacterium woodii]|uniref:DNA internalization-like competence protein/Rec2 n=1 Tax=Acetobacterium woodii (strain ATCC 29683 / DSM 1030 / JCM 2381 / KCTC 1655 / WB1) TaxID=931626 RepID=H6LHA3_ACEWD|nr:DNA internalization-related competence protein ComEC/Rec2 [Acetobacterium woodii]AFA48441.1 DNA internalization-like competence protein/Rec2 [Acetobacterium woodii DSM 1030]
MKRPLLWGFAALSLGVVTSFYRAPLWLILIFSCLLVVMPFFIKQVKNSQVFFILGLFCLGLVLGSTTFLQSDELEPFYEKEVSVLGVVTDYPISKAGQLAIKLKTKEISSSNDLKKQLKKQIGLKTTIYLESDNNSKIKSSNLNYIPGDILLLKGNLSEPAGKRNPGGFDYDLYLKSQSIDALLSVRPENIELIGQETSIYDQILKIKRTLEDQSDAYLSEDVSDLLKGVVFGEKDISNELSQRFQDAGVSHVLAVSGLHVGYLFVALSFLLMTMKIRRQYWIIFLAPMLFFYIALTGFAPSVIRASIMLLCLTLGQGIHREHDALNQLSLAGLIIIWIWPAQLFQAGFQLSMGAVLGIVIFYQPLLYRYEKIRNHKRVKNKITSGPLMQGLILTFCATVGTLPILLYHFKSFTLISFFANIVVVPLIGIFLLTSLVFLLLISCFPFLGPVLSIPVGFLGESIVVMLMGINDVGDTLGFLWINRGGFTVAEIGLFLWAIFLISGYFYLKLPRVKQLVTAVGMGLILILMVSLFLPKNLVVTILDVGQGDSILIETPEGHHYLVDGGGYLFEKSTTISENVLYPVLYSKNIKKLDGVFLTHNHVDHSQGIEELIFDGYPVENLFMSIQTNNEKLLQQQMAPVILLKKGSVIEEPGGITIEVYNPEGKINPKDDDEQNNTSLVMRLSYKNTNLLLCGDIEAAVESQLAEILAAESKKRDFQMIKIPHHGSKTSSTPAFIQAIEPEMAVISVGAHNLFGHPSDEVLHRLEDNDITTLRTDKNGAIEITSNGEWIHYKNYQN